MSGSTFIHQFHISGSENMYMPVSTGPADQTVSSSAQTCSTLLASGVYAFAESSVRSLDVLPEIKLITAIFLIIEFKNKRINFKRLKGFLACFDASMLNFLLKVHA